MTFEHPDFPNISVDTEICFGKPCIKGTRMPVASILAYLSGGMTVEDFTKEFNWIQKEMVLEALSYASFQLEEKYYTLQKVV